MKFLLFERAGFVPAVGSAATEVSPQYAYSRTAIAVDIDFDVLVVCDAGCGLGVVPILCERSRIASLRLRFISAAKHSRWKPEAASMEVKP
ncbi:MAG: hypothetical protein QM772_04840 [Ottowia sp.]|uniref:hypothetical protein n=1 Tax=Ottowia sp. TaxID=1898956 RepID=UPI0039E5C6ED